MSAIGEQSFEVHSSKPLRATNSAHPDRRPSFLITVDTECDDAWTPRNNVSTANARFLPRFQELCESYGLQPTYLTAFEMAACPEFQDFGRDVLKRGQGEIGMHLHAWNSPPLVPLTADDELYHPYLTEYPERVMRDKVNFLTDLLEDTFGTKMTSHRGGRWAFNKIYAGLLAQRGYLADCSVTPLISWESHPGDPDQTGGPDYSGFPALPYFLDLEDISRPGESVLLEVPVTVMQLQSASVQTLQRILGARSLLGRVVNRLVPSVCCLAPTGRNGRRLLQVVKRSISLNLPCMHLALHSSYLMPGGSPFFRTAREVEALYDNLNELFTLVSKSYRGNTITDFRNAFAEA